MANNKLNHEVLFLSVVGVIFIGLTIVFSFFPRSEFSEVERRELAKFPEFSLEKLMSGKYAEEIGAWFSDSEPFRDSFMAAHLSLKDKMGMKVGGDDAVTFHATSDGPDEGAEGGAKVAKDERDIKDFEKAGGAEEVTKVANAGIIVVGTGKNVRALMAFGGVPGPSPYAKVLNEYKKTFGDKVNVYGMVIPTAIEYYCPEKVKSRTKSQGAVIRDIYRQLDPGVKAVDVYTELGKHVDEDIYLRTDHHWSPLGGYYAARRLAEVAGVTVPDLKNFDRHVVRDYVGTMYGYSKDLAVKNAPEDFVYYMPKDSTYTTTYTNFTIDKDFHVTGEQAPSRGSYFIKFKDGASGAYCTFMGGDSKIVKVQTGKKNGRKLVIIKDSFGNTIPGYLFGSFEEVHVLDFRYFPRSLKKYVADNSITDIAVCISTFSAYSGSVADKVKGML